MGYISHQFSKYRLPVGVFLCLLLIASCSRAPSPNTLNANILPHQSALPTLRIAGPFSYADNAISLKGTIGLQIELAQLYAEEHNFRISFISAKGEEDLIKKLQQGKADIGILEFPSYAELTKSPDILSSHTQVIYKRGSLRPLSFEDLAEKRVTAHDSPRFRKQAQFIQAHYPQVTFEFSPKTQLQLLKEINQGKLAFGLIDSATFIHLRSRFHRTKVAFDAFYPESINWILAPHLNEKTINQTDDFFSSIKANGTFSHIKDKYFGHTQKAKPLSSVTFFSRVEQRLPQYQDLIEQIAEKHQIDWRLLAAISYQESHWNPRAKSPTGVRGMMMLTLPTAKELGVKNRLDPAESLDGGAKYLNYILGRLDDVAEPDKTWLALAAYNVGFGHLQDARKITEFHGDDPNRWSDIQRYLPLLEKKDWYSYTTHGKARGREPVNYVRHIRHFKELLEWQFPFTEEELALLAKRKDAEQLIKAEKLDDQIPKNQQQQSDNS
ncbi:MAG: membrane-bound lytic murein transglycosylase MltF [Cellvibrionales bacterium]|nr:membrane-bound lytic murein transglycosylase MltF [Cellvibrionales bacterium]